MTKIEAPPNPASAWPVSKLIRGASQHRSMKADCARCAIRQRCVVGQLPQVQAGIGPVIRERKFLEGEMLSKQGDKGSYLRILKVGFIFICRNTIKGAAHPLAMIGQGRVFDICAYLHQPNQVSVVAASDGHYCEIAVEKVHGLAQYDHDFRASLERTYSESYGLLAQWAEAIAHPMVIFRLATCLKLLVAEQRTNLLIVPTQAALAEMLGTTRESITRAVTTLEEHHCVVRTGHRRFEVMVTQLDEWLHREN